ncbi:hypothetical protein MMC13_000990 [Lambiella insularis]|nr:hypothetical protein [Lambiella insularis]
MLEAIEKLITELGNTQAKLRYAQSTISELELQNKELNSMLGQAYALLLQRGMNAKPETVSQASSRASLAPSISQVSLAPSSRVSLTESEYDASKAKSVWINSTWLVLDRNKALLGPTENAWHRAEKQRALAYIGCAVTQRGILPEQRVDAHLLYSEIIRSTTNGFQQAFDLIDRAFEIARDNDLYGMIGKTQFYRGLCFLDMERFADASWCFVLASHTEGYGQQVDCYRLIAEQGRLALPAADPRRTISEDLR